MTNIQIKHYECNCKLTKLILNTFYKIISKYKVEKISKKINQVIIGETTSDDDLIRSNLLIVIFVGNMTQ